MAKEFAWSFSKGKNFDTCPKRYYEVDVSKNFVETSDQLVWGNEVHNSLAAATCLGVGVPGCGSGRDFIPAAPLPPSMKDYQRWVDSGVAGTCEGVEPWLRHLTNSKCQTLVEQKLAIRRDFTPTTWFGHDVWFRGVCDFARLDPTGTVGLARDYKTGKQQHDSRQLMLMATVLFAHNPTLKKLKTEFVWLKDDCVTPETFDRSTIMREWPPMLTLAKEMEDAVKTQNYQPKPGKLCAKWCPVVSCTHHGKHYR